MNLADDEHRYRYLGFDLDAKHVGLKIVDADTRTIRALLDDAGMPHLVCQSGPSGGRHIWVALVDGISADTVAVLARDLARICKSLDKAPLSNPATGCLRPPLSPHRDGGRSTPIAGTIDAITTPTVRAHQVSALAIAIGELAAAAAPDAALAAGRPLPVDHHGRLYLPGTRRPLAARSEAALQDDAAAGDASAILWRILVGAAAARWRYADVLTLRDEPGLEHVRTTRAGSCRAPRPTTGEQSPGRVLARQWDKAVRYVAANPRGVGDDPTFDGRAGAIASHVEALQERANASPGRWSSGGGASDRRVLDALSILALQAVSVSVEADIRRLALMCGIGRETARTALLRLAADGWIANTALHEGTRAAHWSIDPQNAFHREMKADRSQADPRPGGAGAAHRTHLLTGLTDEQNARTHDTFTAGESLGIHTGNLYAKIQTTPTLDDTQTLRTLQRYGLTRWTRQGWAAAPLRARDDVARRIGAAGTLHARERRYAVEREVWAWWQGELAWMASPSRQRPGRRPSPDAITLYDDGTNRHGKHPRTNDGRADFRLARQFVEIARRHTLLSDRMGERPAA
ncbi:hypothetical protein [Curtobacterium sp. VKM Ac-2887]|uniref:hypothetical protein n=1 Tax=Curtobacterium sp. VKM Ac-2887 TaxID=2783819 RepID=UPI00188BF852|nr:hypothetical protein [Curtobacterium sp. VKM Ac-2887]MBF4588021.1 hypothetical protein [Curtobacterium sp. VKM Ac-2887]